MTPTELVNTLALIVIGVILVSCIATAMDMLDQKRRSEPPATPPGESEPIAGETVVRRWTCPGCSAHIEEQFTFNGIPGATYKGTCPGCGCKVLL